jgi:hypothetical protein
MNFGVNGAKYTSSVAKDPNFFTIIVKSDHITVIQVCVVNGH